MKYIQPLNEPANSPYSNGNPDTGAEGSIIPAQALEAPQREIVNVIAQAARQNRDNETQLSQGSAIEEPLAEDSAQLYKAIRQLACPAGQAMLWGGNVSNIPKGFLICNGQAVSRADYSDLFAMISTKHGEGDGSTTFNLPDLQDRFVIGQSPTRHAGTTGGKFETDGHALTMAMKCQAMIMRLLIHPQAGHQFAHKM